MTGDAVHLDNLLNNTLYHCAIVVTFVTIDARRSHPDLISGTVRVVHFCTYVLIAPFSSNLDCIPVKRVDWGGRW